MIQRDSDDCRDYQFSQNLSSIANQCQFNVQNSAKVMIAMPGSYVLNVVQTETYIDKGCDSHRQNPIIHDLDPGRSQADRLGVLHSFSHPAVDIWLSLLQA